MNVSGDVTYVDGTNNYGPLMITALAPGQNTFTLRPFAVAVLEYYLSTDIAIQRQTQAQQSAAVA